MVVEGGIRTRQIVACSYHIRALILDVKDQEIRKTTGVAMAA
jgi:hypothetical protein